MTSTLRIAFAAAALALALGACQGSFGNSGTEAPGGMAPPVNGPAAGQMNPSPGAMGSMSPPPEMTTNAQNVKYSFTQAAKGLACPTQDGYSCTLYFNMSDDQLAALDAPTPRPNGKHAKATPSPTPSPTPTPTPDASGSPSPSPSPTASPAEMSIALTATPKDAPAMVNPDPKSVSTTALVSLRLKTTSDVLLEGNASARFTLPKEQIGGRGFAIQLFHESEKKKKVSDDFVGSYKQSKLSGNTLIFSFKAPKLQVKKGETWLVVLYGDELPTSSASPQASGSPAASSSPAASGSPAASPAPSVSPSAAL